MHNMITAGLYEFYALLHTDDRELSCTCMASLDAWCMVIAVNMY